MRLKEEITRIKQLYIDQLTDDALFALVSLLTTLNQLIQVTEDADYGTQQDNAVLLNKIIQHQLDILAAPASASAFTSTATSLHIAITADYARSMYGTSPYSDKVLEVCFEFLEGGVLDHPIDYDTAALISALFSTCNLSDEDCAPYINTLRTYVATTIEQLEAMVMPLETLLQNSPALPSTPQAEHPRFDLHFSLSRLSLIFESSYLLHDEFRLRALPLLDILRRYTLRLLNNIDYALPAQPNFRFPIFHFSFSLLHSFFRLLHSDPEGAPTTYHHLLATHALQALDALDARASQAPNQAQPNFPERNILASLDREGLRVCMLDVLAQATLRRECERQNAEMLNTFD